MLAASFAVPRVSVAQAPPPSGLPHGEVYTRITTSRVQKYKIVVAPLLAGDLNIKGGRRLAGSLREVVLFDLDFNMRFDLVNRRIGDDLALISLATAKDRVDYTGWENTRADYLVAGSLIEVDKQPEVDIRVYDLSLKELVFLRNYTLDTGHLRRTAHRISDDIVLNVTGERGIASTQICFIVKTSRLNSEIYASDYDGYNLRPVTADSSTAKMPAWNPNGVQMAYTSFKGDDADLFLVDLDRRATRPLYAAVGVDMTANWCSRNGFMVYSSSARVGNQEIYALPPGESRPYRLTFSGAIDTEPFWSPNGEELAFMSTRAGNPHIFIMGSDGLNLRRLTFESRNTTPRWRPLPYGDKIALTSEINGVFQIAIIDTNGDNFIQLTTDGENRDASWSPDGLHILFASNRRGGPGNFEMYTMDWDGNSQRPLGKQFRQAREPSWGPFLSR
ncbi:MAG: hypothetical protein U9P14_11315 [Gemmatimonadota bacterium]|nr:hypothetical protein [Gemmatimonadota bacterium]